jgi:hypothetical protein
VDRASAGREPCKFVAGEGLQLKRNDHLTRSKLTGGVDAFAGQFSRTDLHAIHFAMVNASAAVAAERSRSCVKLRLAQTADDRIQWPKVAALDGRFADESGSAGSLDERGG